MADLPEMVKRRLIGLTVLHACLYGAFVISQLLGSKGLLFANGTPVGGDFINLWATARLVLSGDFAPIYRPDAFMAFEHTIVDADIGLRLWAYPPHALLFVWPFGLLGFYPALVAWSLLGLLVLWCGARRIGLGRLESLVVLASPASLMCLYYGQTGNLAGGLLLLALSAKGRAEGASALSALVLTVKPQAGFLLPVFLAFERRWALIAVIGASVLIVLGLSVALFGPDAWRDYLGETLPLLDRLERWGSGPFMLMMPSAFMAFRILFGDGSLAGTLHLIFVVPVIAFLLWRLWRSQSREARLGLVLIGTVLITPYMHNYDLTILFCGALVTARLYPASSAVGVLVITAWIAPQAVLAFNALHVPITPLLILPLFVAAGLAPRPGAPPQAAPVPDADGAEPAAGAPAR
jgi:hypothetical protein